MRPRKLGLCLCLAWSLTLSLLFVQLPLSWAQEVTKTSDRQAISGLLGVARLRRLESLPPLLRRLQSQGLLQGLRVSSIEDGIAWMQGKVASLLGVEWSEGLRLTASLAPSPLTTSTFRPTFPPLPKSRLAKRFAKSLASRKARLRSLEADWRPQLQRLVLTAEIAVQTSLFFRFTLRRVLTMTGIPYTEDSIDGKDTFWMTPTPGLSLALVPQGGRLLLLLLWDTSVVQSPSLRRTVWRHWRDLQNSIETDLATAHRRLEKAIPRDHQIRLYLLLNRLNLWLRDRSLPSIASAFYTRLFQGPFASSEAYALGLLADLSHLHLLETVWPLHLPPTSAALPPKERPSASVENLLPHAPFLSLLPSDPQRHERIGRWLEASKDPFFRQLRSSMKTLLFGSSASPYADLFDLWIQPFFAESATRPLQITWATTSTPSLPASLQAQGLLLTGFLLPKTAALWTSLLALLPGVISLSHDPLSTPQPPSSLAPSSLAPQPPTSAAPKRPSPPDSPASVSPPKPSSPSSPSASKTSLWVWWPSGKLPWVLGLKGDRWLLARDLRLASELLSSDRWPSSSGEAILSLAPAWSLLRFPFWEEGWSFTQIEPRWLAACFLPPSAPPDLQNGLSWFSRLEFAATQTPKRHLWRYALPLPAAPSTATSSLPASCPFHSHFGSEIGHAILSPFRRAPLGLLLSTLPLFLPPSR